MNKVLFEIFLIKNLSFMTDNSWNVVIPVLSCTSYLFVKKFEKSWAVFSLVYTRITKFQLNSNKTFYIYTFYNISRHSLLIFATEKLLGQYKNWNLVKCKILKVEVLIPTWNSVWYQLYLSSTSSGMFAALPFFSCSFFEGWIFLWTFSCSFSRSRSFNSKDCLIKLTR